MMVERRLQKNNRREAYVTFNAAGGGTAVIDVPPGPSWEVSQIGVSAVPNTLIPSCTTYVGRSSAGVFISNTLIGDNDTDSQPNVTLRTGESLCAVWENGTVGARGKLTVTYDEVAY